MNISPAQFYELEMQNRQNQQEQKQQQTKALMQGVQDLAGAYIGIQTQKAETKAFGDILEMHGPTIFGEGAIGLLDRYKKGNPQEQRAMMNMISGQFGQQLGQQQYANTMMSRGGAGTGGGMGAGGGGDSFTF